MKKFTQFVSFVAIFLVATLVACNQEGGSGKKENVEVPNLELVYMKIGNSVIDKADLPKSVWKITVDNAKTTLKSNEITAKFNYGTVKEKEIPVTVSNENLQVGSNQITLSCPAIDKKYKKWTHSLVVVRNESSGGGGNDVHFKMKNFKLKTNDNPLEWASAVENNGKWEVEVPNSMTEIKESGDMEAEFVWDNMGTPSPRKLDFTVKETFPVQLAEPAVEKTIEITVAKSEGVYPEFKATIAIKRKAVTNLELKKIGLESLTFTKHEIDDLASGKYEPQETTRAQTVNVFFYSSATATTEDVDLVNTLTTEPVLKKDGSLKVWQLNDAENTLKIKKGEDVIYTIKLKREPIDVDNIVVQANTSGDVIANPVTEGGTYTSKEEQIKVSVTPKQHFKYKTITAEVEGEAAVTLIQTEAEETSPYHGVLTINGGIQNKILVKVAGLTESADLALTRTFTVTKIDNTQPAGGIDPTVAIAKLYIGDGAMDKERVNKFEAQKVVGDDQKYTVNVLKSYGNKQKVALIVEGGDSAKDAKIKDVVTTKDVKADGATVFTSNINYSEVRDNNNEYVFVLENGDKKATYTIALKFTETKENTITVTQPENGQIKFYQLKGKDQKRVDLNIETAGGKSTVKVQDGWYVFIELIANENKTPVKLTIAGKEYKTISTGKYKQTGTGIVVKIKCDQDFEVQGECSDS